MSQPPKSPGIHKEKFQPGDRLYTIAIPESYRQEVPAPMILVLHWGGAVLPYTGAVALMGLAIPALYELESVMVAPDRTSESWTDQNSEAELLELLDFVEDSYNIDKSRTLVTGYSLGGIGAWYLAARHQNRFAAAIPISAVPAQEALEAKWEIPLYVIHSQTDKHFPLGKVVEPLVELKEKGVSVQLDILEDVGHYDTTEFVEPLKRAVPWIKRAWG